MKRFVGIFFAVISACCVCAQSSVWKVTNGDNVLYLGGSVHLLRAEDFPLPKEFDMAYRASQKMVFETDVTSLSVPEFAQKMATRAMLPEGKTLKSVLNAKVYAKLERACAECNIPMEGVQQLKPAMLMNMLEMLRIARLGFSLQGADIYYFAKAAEWHKEWTFLESIDFQLDLLTTMGDGYEDEFVKYSLKDLDNIEKDMLTIVSEWRAGGVNLLTKALKKEKRKYPTVCHKMFTERNNSWMPQIERMLQDEKVEFVLVGYAHLLGADGLLQLLKDKGYAVEQLK